MTAPFEVCRGLGQDLGPTSRSGHRGGHVAKASRHREELRGIPFAGSACGSGAFGGLGDAGDEEAEGPAAVEEDLAAEQVEALNAVGALMDGVESVVAIVLLDVVITV